MITIAQKSDIRRHLGYPVGGLPTVSPVGGTFASGSVGYRFTEAYGFLEYTMNNLTPDEEARTTGQAYAADALVGPQPVPGNSMTVVFSGGNIPVNTPQTITVYCPSPAPAGDLRLYMVAAMAAAVSQNNVLQAAGIIAVAPYGTGQFTQNVVPLPEVGFMSPVPFSIVASGVGAAGPQITATGTFLSPSTSLDGINTIWGFLPILNGLENTYIGSSQNMDTKQADVWHSRSNEAGMRMSLYKTMQGRFSDFLGTPINPLKKNSEKTSTAMAFF